MLARYSPVCVLRRSRVPIVLFFSHRSLHLSPLLSARPFAPPPLALDPPFTPVPGESAALQQLSDAASERRAPHEPRAVVFYLCACGAPLFSGAAYAIGSACGAHRGGWPSFRSPASPRALRTRGLLQRAAVPGGSRGLRATMAARGLRVERDVARDRGGGNKRVRPSSWREQCLRDENKRSDPALLEGCCAKCEAPVCRIVTERGGEVKYVVNPSAVRAVAASAKEE